MPSSLFFRSKPHLLAAAILVIPGSVLHANVVLNEIMADNRGSVENGADLPDYVELLNRAAQPADLSNWSLTDDALLPRKFVFPAGTAIPAGGRLIVWCDLNLASPGLHTGFGLGSKGDLVRLYSADGVTIADEISFGLQVADRPLGRIPDGTGTWTLTVPTPNDANAAQPVAEHAALRINEWMARPSVGDDWIELFNPEELPAAIGGFAFSDRNATPSQNRPIPALSFIAARGFVQFFASDLRQPDADHLDFRLGAGGETLNLFGADLTTVVDRVTFGAQADNVAQGRSPDGADAFATFPVGLESPGRANAAESETVVINEVLTHTDPPLEDAIELHNPGTSAVDISHWWLSDSLSQPQKYRIPAGTVIPSGGFAVFYQYQFSAGASGFSLNSYEGDSVVLSSGAADGSLTGRQTSVRFGAMRNGVSLGRVATSTGVDFVSLSLRTFGNDFPLSLPQFRQGTGLTNSSPLISPVVINEIHFQPGTGMPTTDEFIELHNPTDANVPLFDPLFPTNAWRIRDGITFDLPTGITVPAGGFVLVTGFDPADTQALADFRTRYSVPANVPVYGPFSGRLSDTGEALEFQQPDKPEGIDDPNYGFVPYEVRERIRYSMASPWPVISSGSGASLQRSDAKTYGNEPLNWMSGAPTPGRSNSAGPGPDTDSDGDGMPDLWETANNLDPMNRDDALVDSDLDGHLNRDEYLAGTNPRDATSVFRIVELAKTDAGYRLRFNAVASRAYTVGFRGEPSGGDWQVITNLPSVGSAGVREAEITTPSAERGFLRVTTGP
jgi:hypothetical protein